MFYSYGLIKKSFFSIIYSDFIEKAGENQNLENLKGNKQTAEKLKKLGEEINGVKTMPPELGIYEISNETLEKLEKAKDGEEKMKIMQDKISHVQSEHPSTWLEHLPIKENSWNTKNLSKIEIFFLEIIAFLTGKELFGEIGGADFSPDRAGELIGGDMSCELGALSEHFESGGKGPNAINPNDNGKPSFGTYQLRDEMLKKFIDSYPSLDGYPEGYDQIFERGKSSNFSNWWNKMVSKIGVVKFKEMEHSFIKNEFYNKQVNKIRNLNININDFPITIQNVVWSTAVQHGQNTDIILEAINKNGGLRKGDVENMKSFVDIVYKLRLKTYGKGEKRYNSERVVALQNLNLSVKGTGLENIAGVRSVSPEISRNGITLCSKTARLNAAKYGITISRGASAKDSYEKSGSPKGEFPPENSNARFADVFLDASTKNKKYGHRAFGVQVNGKWYILDPYYTIPGMKDRQSAIPAEKYIAYMGGTKGRKFWGANFFS
ncbi:hypothetical protein CSB07_00440 [Candidatus Gracilibacteria bacterium]|nr:MAG: hypothetical protein CSB07_00440 [Candidatus Gracilibacteria bacterium]PIE85108.1 MAG: hypothetical protein CSA08_03625 [Candidatus Gracilibacteria bacterium]